MKKKPLIIVASVLFLGALLSMAYYYFYLKKADRNITTLNIPSPDDFETNPSSYIIKGDVHPTKKTNSYYTKEISKFIHLNK